MIFHGRINIVDKLTLKDGGVLHELRMSDVSKPSALRTGGEFITYVPAEKRKDLPEGDLADSIVTIAVKEAAAGKGGAVKLKGQVLAGLIPVDKIAGREGELPKPPQKAS